jgi:putative lipoprotein
MRFALAFVVVGFPFGGPPERPPEDRWFARDKAMHFATSAVLQSVGYTLLRSNGLERRDAAWTAGAATLSVGVGKELWDQRSGGTFSWKDLAADGAGAGAGAVLIRRFAP